MAKGGWVYIMVNRYRGGMYVGVTSDALARVNQHREWKFALIEADNPEWDDLWWQWFAPPPEQK
ncbi:MAG: hypothetical protein CVT75_00370 [Alphaproteobacteria bacterium HGW-Alphaproteobacteria-14]|nr:MAG: hypothetical protein CVT75_00370 [Alphaproteobacteria bacterium HGW-Alphaproteobacteria-14]